MKLKQLPAFLSIFFQLTNPQAFAADTTSTTSTTNSNITSETSTNQVLLDNAAKSATSTGTTNYLKVLNGSDASASAATNLTDEQKQLSENYVHQGLANRVIQKGCSGDENQQICSGQDPKAARKAIINGVAKAYAAFGAMIDDKFLALKKPEAKATMTKTDPATPTPTPTPSATPTAAASTKPESENGAGKDKKEETQTDYCKYIPAATETISMYMSQSSASALSSGTSSGETAQKETLLKAAKNHDDRATAAKINSYGWLGGAACYVTMYATGTAALNTAIVVKTAAAGFLGKVYYDEIAENEGYAKKVRDLANSLPGKGDCNPITQKACYCSQPETMNDTTYCAAELHKKAIATTSTRVTCVDNTMKADPSCSCDKTNTCFEKLMLGQDINNTLGFGTSSGSAFSPIRKLTDGELVGGQIGYSALNNLAAIGKKGLSEMSNKIPGSNNLSKNDLGLYKAYTDAGIPSNAAAHLAGTNFPKAALDAGMAKASGLSGNVATVASISGGGNHLVDFSGSGKGIGNKAVGKKDEDFIGKLGVNKKEGGQNNKLIEFAVQKSQQSNQISKTESSIFEIISNRYAGSAFRLLDLENKN